MEDLNKPKTQAECYEISYHARYNALAPEMKARVDANKRDDKNKDYEVKQFIRGVAEAAEYFFEHQNDPKDKGDAKKKLNKTLKKA